jgi:hypothetical protein
MIGHRLRSWSSEFIRGRPSPQPPETPGLIARLEEAVDGLLYPSETDAPVKVFVWRGEAPFSQQALLETGGHGEKTPIKITGIERFFGPVTTPQSWHEEEEQKRTQRFTALRDLLETELTNIEVYKVGSVKIDMFVIGRTADGTYCGISTQVVET